MAQVIAVCNQKGGVAKTTSAINIAAYLAIEHKKTLLIDLDPQSNATSGVGIDKHSISSSIYNVLHEHVALVDIFQKTAIDNLLIAPSNIDLTGAEVELVNVMSREYKLKKAIATITDMFDYVIIDCPPSLGLLTINGLAAADSLIIPIQCEYYALEGLTQLMNTITIIRENLNSSLAIEGVLLTMADYRTRLTREVIDEVKKFFGDKVYKTIIPRTIKLTEAPGFGKPIALYDSHSIGAESYHNVTRELLGIYAEPIEISHVMTEKEIDHGQEIGEGDSSVNTGL
ncbi:MAG: ParA family protein [Candidatus Omnitrophota bacterium]